MTTILQPPREFSPPAQGNPQHGPAAGPNANGATTQSNVFYDERGVRRRSAKPVPVDMFGKVTGVQFSCRRCKTSPWLAAAVASRGMPVCTSCGRRMAAVPIQTSSAIPWAAIKAAVAVPLRPVALLAAVGAVGVAEQGHVPHLGGIGLLAGAVLVGFLVMAVTQRWLIRRARITGAGRSTAPRRARGWGYSATLITAWLAVAALTGVDRHTVGGKAAWTVLAAGWALAAGTWWRAHRRIRPERRPDVVEVDLDSDEIPMDPDEAQTRHRWNTIVAGRTTGTPGAAKKLPGSTIEDWHKVVGGCGFTAVGPDGMYVADSFTSAQGSIASAFKMKRPMVTILPDDDDENRALILLQRTSPIGAIIRWTGPGSIDPAKGTAPIAVYADGEHALYEIYRPNWGSPHVGVFGTTGSGKSEALCQMFTIDRWASYVDAAGVRRGMVASFLIDPQQGQSFAPFLDDLAAPVAGTVAEAKLLVAALSREMLRRNRYLAREAKTWDERRKKWRKGRKWWNPLLDGPILTLTIDEAHEYLSDREFCKMVVSSARMWRKCGGQIRIGTHTPLLADLGGSMALRDMLSSGFVAVFRTANSLSGPVAFNGRLTADPRAIPVSSPGSCYALTGLQPKSMLARFMWEPDYYDIVRDEEDKPIGYPAELPAETLDAFGPDYAAWVAHSANPDAAPYIPQQTSTPVEPEAPATCVDAVVSVLAAASLAADPANYPMGMAALDAGLKAAGHTYSTRTVRGALAQLRQTGHVQSDSGRHSLTAEGEEQLAALVVGDGVGDSP